MLCSCGERGTGGQRFFSTPGKQEAKGSIGSYVARAGNKSVAELLSDVIAITPQFKRWRVKNQIRSGAQWTATGISRRQ